MFQFRTYLEKHQKVLTNQPPAYIPTNKISFCSTEFISIVLSSNANKSSSTMAEFKAGNRYVRNGGGVQYGLAACFYDVCIQRKFVPMEMNYPTASNGVSVGNNFNAPRGGESNLYPPQEGLSASGGLTKGKNSYRSMMVKF